MDLVYFMALIDHKVKRIQSNLHCYLTSIAPIQQNGIYIHSIKIILCLAISSAITPEKKRKSSKTTVWDLALYCTYMRTLILTRNRQGAGPETFSQSLTSTSC